MGDRVGEHEVALLVERVRAAPARRGELVGLLAEDAAVHAGRGTTGTARIRAWVLAAFADVGLPEEALPYVWEELESGREPLVVAAAARALRGGDSIDATAAEFLVRALVNVVDIDEPVSFDALRPSWPVQRSTTALLEILDCLAEADGAPAVRTRLEAFRRDHCAALGAAAAGRLEAAITVASGSCCGASAPPVGHDGRTVSDGALPATVDLEDQDGTRLAFTDVIGGRPTVLTFFYTRCSNPNKCSLTITKLAELQRRVEDDAIGIAAVTYDPGFDRPDRLRRYGTDRGLRFGPSTRMLRAVTGHDVLREHFALRVGYGGSVVNRHGIELFLLDGRGVVRHTWSRVRWDPPDVLARASALASAASAAGANTLLMSTVTDMNDKRSFDMSTRAEAAAQTRRRILQATLALCMEAIIVEITLDDVAGRAGVSVKTVLRHFGSRDGLFEELEVFGRDQLVLERYAPPGDVGAAVRAVFDHYELRGDAVLRMLGQELWDDRIRSGTDEGRRMHREWVETVFAPMLHGRSVADREALVDMLVVAADVYTWKLLRRDRGLPRDTAERRVRRMIDSLLGGSGEDA